MCSGGVFLKNRFGCFCFQTQFGYNKAYWINSITVVRYPVPLVKDNNSNYNSTYNKSWSSNKMRLPRYVNDQGGISFILEFKVLNNFEKQ